jgi:hypothetical protein
MGYVSCVLSHIMSHSPESIIITYPRGFKLQSRILEIVSGSKILVYKTKIIRIFEAACEKCYFIDNLFFRPSARHLILYFDKMEELSAEGGI